jgi:hypothetical protein
MRLVNDDQVGCRAEELVASPVRLMKSVETTVYGNTSKMLAVQAAFVEYQTKRCAGMRAIPDLSNRG